MSEHTLIPPFVKFPLVIAGIAFSLWSATKCIAAVSNFRATSYLEAWQTQRKHNSSYQTPEADFNDGLNASLRAQKLAPYNSDYHKKVADILLWQIQTQPNLSATDKQRIRTDILNHYQTAISIQPFWPYHHAHYAITKAQLGEADQEMMTAMHNANRYGAYETFVMHVIIELGLRLWPQMDHTTRLLIANNIDRITTLDIREDLASQEKVFALGTVGLYQRAADVCPLLKTNSEQIRMMCKFTKTPNSTKART